MSKTIFQSIRCSAPRPDQDVEFLFSRPACNLPICSPPQPESDLTTIVLKADALLGNVLGLVVFLWRRSRWQHCMTCQLPGTPSHFR